MAITKTPEKLARIAEARRIRGLALDCLDLGIIKGSFTKDEAVKWVDLIYRSRSLDDIVKLKGIIQSAAGLVNIE
ncbi:hypothetical protein ES705_50141 [subsurface metagenome]